MTRYKYWEEMGWSTEWYYHRYRILTERLSDDDLVRFVQMHGDKAAETLRTGVVCPNVRRYAAVMQRVAALTPAPTADLPLFALR